MVARDFDLVVRRTAEHLRWSTFKVQAALNYGKAFADEDMPGAAEKGFSAAPGMS